LNESNTLGYAIFTISHNSLHLDKGLTRFRVKKSPSLGTLTEVGRLSTVDLLVLTSLDQVLLILANIISFFTKQATLLKSSNVLSLPIQLVFPALACPVPTQWVKMLGGGDEQPLPSPVVQPRLCDHPWRRIRSLPATFKLVGPSLTPPENKLERLSTTSSLVRHFRQGRGQKGRVVPWKVGSRVLGMCGWHHDF
jgi:hypothetical protein